MNIASRTALIFVAILLGCSAHAKIFRNAYISFELPPNWNCNLEGTEWVCVSQFSNKSKEAIIILTAKEAGPTDSLAAYESHLKAPRTIPSSSGSPVTSKVISVRQRRITDNLWIDGMHLGSEVASYYTRYLATIKDRIAILVTFSAHKEHYTKYANDFLKAIQSMRVVATKDLLTNRPNMAPRAGSETIGAPIGAVISSDMGVDEYPEEDSSGSGASLIWLLFALVLGCIGYVLYKRKMPKAKGSSSSSKKSSRSGKPGPKK